MQGSTCCSTQASKLPNQIVKGECRGIRASSTALDGAGAPGDSYGRPRTNLPRQSSTSLRVSGKGRAEGARGFALKMPFPVSLLTQRVADFDVVGDVRARKRRLLVQHAETTANDVCRATHSWVPID